MAEIQYDDTKVRARIDGMTERVRAAVRAEAITQRILLFGVVQRKLSGEVLNVRTGDLRASIFQDEPVNTKEAIVERVAQSAQVKYGRIHEYGGKTSAHDIYPVKAQALYFVGKFGMYGATEVFAKVVHHPGSTIPERSFMRSALEERRSEIIAGLAGAAAAAVEVGA